MKIGQGQSVSFTIKGEPASKANSRRLVFDRRTKRPRFIKSAKALGYLQAFQLQCPVLPTLLEGDLAATIHIHYASRRPDLDESVILDAMQGRVYSNDRQVRERHTYWHIDPADPRAEITIYPLGQSPG